MPASAWGHIILSPVLQTHTFFGHSARLLISLNDWTSRSLFTPLKSLSNVVQGCRAAMQIEQEQNSYRCDIKTLRTALRLKEVFLKHFKL